MRYATRRTPEAPAVVGRASGPSASASRPAPAPRARLPLAAAVALGALSSLALVAVLARLPEILDREPRMTREDAATVGLLVVAAAWLAFRTTSLPWRVSRVVTVLGALVAGGLLVAGRALSGTVLDGVEVLDTDVDRFLVVVLVVAAALGSLSRSTPPAPESRGTRAPRAAPPSDRGAVAAGANRQAVIPPAGRLPGRRDRRLARAKREAERRASDERSRRKHAEAEAAREKRARIAAERAAERERAARLATMPQAPALVPDLRRTDSKALNGRWEILPGPPVGGGGFGFVFRVRNVRPDLGGPMQAVAKLLVADPARALGATAPEANEWHRERLIREIELTSSLASPYIVEVHDGGYDREMRMTFLVMTHYQAGSLESFVGGLSHVELDRVLAIAGDVFSGLAYLHGLPRGIVHRDLKPSNVLLRDGLYGAVICDFSISRIAELTRETITQGQPVLSWFYAPLEQYPDVAGPHAGPRPPLDVHAAGACLYTMLTGLAPYEREVRSLAAARGTTPGELLRSDPGLYRRLLEAPDVSPLPLAAIQPSLPPGLVRFVEACMAPDPAMRPQSAAAVDELRRLRVASPPAWVELDAARSARAPAPHVVARAGAGPPASPDHTTNPETVDETIADTRTRTQTNTPEPAGDRA